MWPDSFETDGLLLKKLTKNDADLLQPLLADPRVANPCGWQAAKTMADVRKRVEKLIKFNSFLFYEKATGAMVGSASIRFGIDAESEKDDEPELGYFITPSAWGKGYAAEGSRPLIDYAFKELGSKAVWVCTDIDNPGSQRVAEKLGFSFLRTNKGYGSQKDELVYILNR